MAEGTLSKIKRTLTNSSVKKNAAPKSYRIRFIEPGIISYEDQGDGTVFVSKEALDRMAPTFKGCPVICVPEHHNDSEPNTAFNFENAGDPVPAGIVATDPYWGDDGWQWINVLVWDPDAQDAIDNKDYSASCAYVPTEEGPAGVWHNISYDAEMTNGKYLHMAIVPRPRYEGAKILANSKGATMAIKIFGKRKRNAEETEEERKKREDEERAKEAAKKNAEEMAKHPGMEAINADPDSVVQLPGGGEATLQELIDAYKEAAPEDGGEEDELDPDDQVDVDGKTVTIAELIAAYQAKKGGGTENADPPTDTQASEVVDPKAQGEGVRSNSAGRPKVNATLKNAAQRAGDELARSEMPETRSQRIARGKARYSRAVAQEVK